MTEKLTNFQRAVSTLRTILARVTGDAELTSIIKSRDEVLGRYQNTFDVQTLSLFDSRSFDNSFVSRTIAIGITVEDGSCHML